ncbi:hypothetical protein [Ruegeria arenilitoris]|uniref:hypothetical protein n=1 Tax=Ruegeria arenilitoris TaxID=1173585 RepID=UPI00148075A7|nr:hypothetical protein [Ruegeria arenilitoris]
MFKSSKSGMAAWVVAPFLGVAAASAAMAEPQVCNANTARIAANDGDYATLCGCSQVTPSFLSHLQQRADFGSVLANTSQQCPGLANLLSDLPTGSISNANSFDGRENDPSGFQPASSTGPSAGGGSGSGGGNGGPGNGGGNDDPGDGGSDDPGNGGGNDDPGNGGGKPGDGGGKPGKGGDKPGKGGGKPGHGDGKPGKGGGHGGGKGKNGDGKGGGKGNNGGGKGNNGGGNGPEGSSPGRGNNANNDEN